MSIGDRFDGRLARRTARTRISRVLVISQRFPWPAYSGSDMRTANTIAALRSAGIQTGVAALAPTQTPVKSADALYTWSPDRVDLRGSSGARALDWIRETDGHPSDRWWTAQARAAVQVAIAEFDPQLVVLEHLWTHRVLALAACSARRTILSAHNVEGPLHATFAGSSGGQAPDALAALMATRTSEIEAATVARVDRVWACSDADAKSFKQHYPHCAPVEVVPNAIKLGRFRSSRPALQRPLLLFIGSFGYPPNAQAALWLGEQVLPALQASGISARLRLIGADPPRAVRQLAEHPAIQVMGFVEDLSPHLAEAALVPVPIFAGGGTRFKVLEAFAAGIPVVSTSKGVEGITATKGEEYVLAETVEEFTAAICALCTDHELYAHVAHRARALVERRYSMDAVHAIVKAALDAPSLYKQATKTP